MQLQVVLALEALVAVRARDVARDVVQGHVLGEVDATLEHGLADAALAALAAARVHLALVEARVLARLEHLAAVLARRGARRVVQRQVLAQDRAALEALVADAALEAVHLHAAHLLVVAQCVPVVKRLAA